jgi:hypothetical protein
MGSSQRDGFDQGYAWRLAVLLDRELEAMKAAGWRCSPKAAKRAEVLIAARSRAENAENMAAYERNCAAILKLARHDFRQQQRWEPASRNVCGDPGS